MGNNLNMMSYLVIYEFEDYVKAGTLLWKQSCNDISNRDIYTQPRLGPCLARLRLDMGWTSEIWTSLESEVLTSPSFQTYEQTKALCSRQQMMYNGTQTKLGPATKQSSAWLTSVLAQLSVNMVFRIQPEHFCKNKFPNNEVEPPNERHVVE